MVSPGTGIGTKSCFGSICGFFDIPLLLFLVLGTKLGDSASESDSSSLDGGAMLPPSTVSRDQLQKRIESLQQQNRYYFHNNLVIIRANWLRSQVNNINLLAS